MGLFLVYPNLLGVHMGLQKFPHLVDASGKYVTVDGCKSDQGKLSSRAGLFQWAAALPRFTSRGITTFGNPVESVSQDYSSSESIITSSLPHVVSGWYYTLQILDKEDVEEVRMKREKTDIKPGYIVQLKVEVPENKRRISILKGIVIARRNAGLNNTFRIRRLVAGVGVESLFLLYSPNIKEIKVLDKKKVRRAKLYYLRDKMNALKKQ
ncbi:50S ribosomal protein L19-1, chloroplastic-like [Quercus lobata]|uniref:50S ribosomal protein L19-1, chloroplastic-like n=1 Tax=Quercus lobata TaxID=97700 RepID=UPI0012446796|nr:50S ribosomal protein L19-1, chloroplastic-like [Quercus lobata]